MRAARLARWTASVLCGVVGGMLAGLAGADDLGGSTAAPAAQEPARLAGVVGKSLSGGESSAPRRDNTPWAVSPAMHDWARRHVPTKGGPRERLARLHRALVSPLGLRVRERLGASATAADVFRSRRADCVGFAYLLAGLARALDLDARFVDARSVDARATPSVRSRRVRKGLRLQQGHVAVSVRDGDLVWVADHAGLRLAKAGDRPLPDPVAAALLASNRGARHLLAGRCEAARRELQRAVVAAPHHAPFRANLAAAARCR